MDLAEEPAKLRSSLRLLATEFRVFRRCRVSFNVFRGFASSRAIVRSLIGLDDSLSSQASSPLARLGSVRLIFSMGVSLLRRSSTNRFDRTLIAGWYVHDSLSWLFCYCRRRSNEAFFRCWKKSCPRRNSSIFKLLCWWLLG